MNCNSSIRSNYFKITDRNAFEKLCGKLSGEDFLSVKVSINEKNMAWHFLPRNAHMDDDIDLNQFYELLQHIIDPNDAAIFVTIDQEGMRYIGGDAVIITITASYIKTYGKWPSKKQELCSNVQNGRHNTSISIILA